MKRWNLDYYTVFIPELDEQHKKLFTHMVEFIELVRQGTGTEELIPLLNFLEEYSKEHFAAEEAAMAQYDCRTKELNVEEHRNFGQRLAAFKAELAENGASLDLAGRVHKELYLWFIGHIARIDKALCEVVDEKPAKTIHQSIDIDNLTNKCEKRSGIWGE